MDLGTQRHAEGVGTQRRMISALLDASVRTALSADRAGKMDLYGRFVGSWDLDVRQFSEDGTRTPPCRRMAFRLGAGGRAIQDVWIVPPRGELRHGRCRGQFQFATAPRCGSTIPISTPGGFGGPIRSRGLLQMIGRAEGPRHRAARYAAGRPRRARCEFSRSRRRIRCSSGAAKSRRMRARHGASSPEFTRRVPRGADTPCRIADLSAYQGEIDASHRPGDDNHSEERRPFTTRAIERSLRPPAGRASRWRPTTRRATPSRRPPA